MTDLTMPTFPLATATTAGALADRLVEAVVEELTRFESSTAPGLVLPRVYAGHAVVDDTVSDLLYTVGLLVACGVEEIAGVELRSILAPSVARLEPSDTEGFASYRVGETVLRLGGIETLPTELRPRLLDAVTSPNVIESLNDPTAIPPNFAIVAARCSRALEALGGRSDDVAPLLARVRDMFDTPNGWIDDGMADWVHYDIYTPDMYLFAEPLADDIGEPWRVGLTRVIADLDDLVQPGGAVVWGRSIGSLGLAITIELAAAATAHELEVDRARWLARADETLGDLRGWFRDGVLAAHQGRRTMSYRGPARRLQMTLDILGKLLLAALDLRRRPAEAGAEPSGNWAPVDRLLVFDADRSATAWTHRSPALTFAMATVFGFSSDYAPSPRGPRLFEQPTSGHPVMVPVISARRRDPKTGAATRAQALIPAAMPTAVSHGEHGVEVAHEGWAPVGEADPIVQGSRRARYRVDGRTLVVDEHLTFDDPDDLPGPLSITVAGTSERPIDVHCEDARVLTVDTAGLAEWHSFWGPLPRVHQIELEAAPELRIHWRVTPRLRVAHTMHGHTYDKALYGPLRERLVTSAIGLPNDGLVRRLRDVDVLHLAWPEWWTGLDPAHTAAVIDQVRRTGTGIVWTMHNLLPHGAKTADAEACYRLWAQAADAVIHHTAWGRDVALDTYEYGPDTTHHVIAHGHWGGFHDTHEDVDRSRVERDEGWPSEVLRLAVVGAPRREKDVQLVLDAVAACGRHDIQLVARVPQDAEVPEDPRIVAEQDHLGTEVYLRRFRAFDAVVLPFTRQGMLTTGTAFDCIGAGVPAITSRWGFFDETFAGADIRFGTTVADLTACLEQLDTETLARARGAMWALRPRFEWTTIADETCAVLEEVADRHA